MSHQSWDIERNAKKGVRAVVKVFPTGALKNAGMRYRMLRGKWHKSGNEMHDYYLSSQGLRARIADIEAAYMTPNA